MSEVRGTGRSLALASSWQSRNDGALAEFAAGHPDAGARAIAITLGDFSGLAIRYGVDGTHLRQ